MDIFKLKKNNTTVFTEICAGVTVFFAAAYMFAVNSEILNGAGMDKGAVFTAMVLASFIGTLCMAFFSNCPFVLAPCLGASVYFTQTAASEYGWEVALCAVFAEGIIFILISFINVRDAVFNSIPKNLKYAVSVGLGFFLAYFGLKNSGIINIDGGFITFGKMNDVAPCLTVIGIIIIGVMSYYRVKGAMLWGILIIYALGAGCELIGWYEVSDKVPSVIPETIISFPLSIESVNIIKAFQSVKFEVISLTNFLALIVSFLFIDMGNAAIVFTGLSEKSGVLDEKGKFPRLKEALLSDAAGTVVGAILGANVISTCTENAVGTAQGGKTGLTSFTAAILILLLLFFSPIFLAIPNFVIAPVLITSGVFMIDSVLKIDFSDFTESIPAFLIIIIIPFSSNIVSGVTVGVLSYVVLKVLTGRRNDVNMALYVIAIIFLLKLLF